jgi:hypothetical protein
MTLSILTYIMLNVVALLLVLVKRTSLLSVTKATQSTEVGLLNI